MRASSEELCYDPLTVRLHWLTAGLTLLLWIIAQMIDLFPRGPLRIAARSVHILLGVALTIVVMWRMFWRASRGRELPPVYPGAHAALTKLLHYALYALLMATVALGLTNVAARGDSIFGLLSIPSFTADDRELRHTIERLHGGFANAILIGAGLHAAAALIHHCWIRDGMLRRMWPRAGARAARPPI